MSDSLKMQTAIDKDVHHLSSGSLGQLRIQTLLPISLLGVAVYFISYYMIGSLVAEPLKLVSGLLSFLIVPGGLVNEIAIPERMRNIWTAIATGFVLVVLEIQFLLSMQLLLGLSVPLAIWLALCSLSINIAFIPLCYGKQKKYLKQLKIFTFQKELLVVLSIALILRLLLLWQSQGAIAPDASLYSDYARNIVEGNFTSNVMMDTAVSTLWSGQQMIEHQGMTYLFALSFILFTPGLSGPSVVLIISGLLLVVLGYMIASKCFDKRAAIWIAGIIAVHPLFVFHSVVAYGPEIISLVFFLYGILLLFEKPDGNFSLTMSGLVLGVMLTVWYPNYFVLCFILPILLYAFKPFSRWVMATLCILVSLILIAVVLGSLDSLAVIAVIGIAVGVIARLRIKEVGGLKPLMLFSGILAVLFFFKWMSSDSSMHLLSDIIPNNGEAGMGSFLAFVDIARYLIIPNIDLLLRQLLFIVFHTTVPVLMICLRNLLFSKHRKVTSPFIISACVISGGLSFIFASFNAYKETLLWIYIYSDSRFFLSIVMVLLISLGPFFTNLKFFDGAPRIIARNSHSIRRRSAAVLAIIMIGFVPGYLSMQTGLDLTNIETRYGWAGVGDDVNTLGSFSSIFLVDRAREFAWLTGRITHTLALPMGDTVNALHSLQWQHESYNVNYFVLDAYTVAHWRTLSTVYNSMMFLGEAIVTETEMLQHLTIENSTIIAESLVLVVQTNRYANGDHTKIFRFDMNEFNRAEMIRNIGSEWFATNDGMIDNQTDMTRLTIGPEANSTTLKLQEGLSLNISGASGFVLCSIIEESAAVANIELLDASGIDLKRMYHIGNGLYFIPIGRDIIKDIQIYIEGDPGDSVLIRSISVWEST